MVMGREASTPDECRVTAGFKTYLQFLWQLAVLFEHWWALGLRSPLHDLSAQVHGFRQLRRASARPAYASFTGKCFPSTGKKNVVASTKYWLKLSVLCDLLEIILCTLGSEASGSSCWTGSLPVMFSKLNSEHENFHCHWQQNWVWLQSIKGELSVHNRLFFPHQHWRTCTSLLRN